MQASATHCLLRGDLIKNFVFRVVSCGPGVKHIVCYVASLVIPRHAPRVGHLCRWVPGWRPRKDNYHGGVRRLRRGGEMPCVYFATTLCKPTVPALQWPESPRVHIGAVSDLTVSELKSKGRAAALSDAVGLQAVRPPWNSVAAGCFISRLT
jgi:hypothetical protein